MDAKKQKLIFATLATLVITAALTAGVFIVKDSFKISADNAVATTQAELQTVVAKGKLKSPDAIRAVELDGLPSEASAAEEMTAVAQSGFNTVILAPEDESTVPVLASAARQTGLYCGIKSTAAQAAALLADNNFDFIILTGTDELSAAFEADTVTLCDTLRHNDPGVSIGIEPKNPQTVSEALTAVISAGHADFLYLKQGGGRGAKSAENFTNARAAWSEAGIPLWLCHSLDRLNEITDEQSVEVISLFSQSLENPLCSGLVFAPYSQIKSAEGGAAKTILNFIKEGVESAADKDFKITNYDSESISVTQSKITFKGTSSPAYPLTCNGKELERAASGDFASEFSLKAGENTFKFAHKEKTYTYKVNYKIKLLSSVSPTGSVSVPGSTELEVTAIAKKDATLTASFNGSTVKMTRGAAASGEEGESPDSESDFVMFSAVFTLPAGKASAQKLGKITVKADYGSLDETLSGASVTVTAVEPAPKPQVPTEPSTAEQSTEASSSENPQSTSETPSGSEPAPTEPPSKGVEKCSPDKNYGYGTAKLCVVTADYAEVFPSSTTSTLSVPLLTPQLKGTTGYVTGEMDCTDTKGKKEHYYVLSSGIKVLDEEARLIPSGYVMPDNQISVKSSGESSDGLRIVLDMSWKVPVNAVLSGQSYKSTTINGTARPYAVSSLNGGSLDLTFSYTALVSGSVSAGAGGVSSASWSANSSAKTVTLSLRLANPGKFYGYHMEYNSSGELVITVNGKPSSTLSGYTVMLDPGHGGVDSGAVCSVSSNAAMKYESYINLSLATKIKALLEAEGANVIMTRSSDTYVSPEARVALVRSRNPDLFISVHCDSSPSSSSAIGTSAFYYRAYSQPLASAVHSRLVAAYKDTVYASNSSINKNSISRGASFYPFQVTRVEECPAILIEYGFVSNITECEALQNSSNRDALARATVQGIKDYISSS